VRPIAEYRSLARKLCEFACDGYNGRPESDPVYQDVTEGRDVGAIFRTGCFFGSVCVHHGSIVQSMPAGLWAETSGKWSTLRRLAYLDRVTFLHAVTYSESEITARNTCW
jgi:hypothetical protein